MRSASILLTVLVLAWNAPAAADRVSDAIRAAGQAYQDGKLSKARKELQYAIGQIQRRVAKAYEATMPRAPSGWRALRPRARRSAGIPMFTGHTVSRRYVQNDGAGRINAQLIVDNPMLTALAGMFANPQIAATAGFERVRLRGRAGEGLIKYDPDRRRGEAMVLVAGRIYIKLTGRGIDNDRVLRDMLDGFDFDKIAGIAGLR